MNGIQYQTVNNESDLSRFQQLLKNSKLAYHDIKLENSSFMFYCDMDGEIIGTGGLEFYSNYALLRSVSVISTQRGKDIGHGIVRDLLLRAKSKSVIEVYLLTETAHDFFIKLGFDDVLRDSVPDAVKESSEFSSVCPVSAACMVYSMV